MACAAALGDRVTATAVAAGMGQMGVWAEADDFAKTDRRLLRLCVNHPAAARLLLGVSARLAKASPASALKSFAKELSDSDRATLVEQDAPPQETMALFTRAFQNGAQGVVDDYRTIARPWGVTLGASGPVTIWQGDDDTMVPLRHAEALHAAMPGSTLLTGENDGNEGG